MARNFFIVLLLAALAVAAVSTTATAGDPTGAGIDGKAIYDALYAGKSAQEAVGMLAVAVNFIWVFLAATLVFFMQAGFALVEAGFCRAKHATHVIMTNFTVFAVAALAYWAIGFALMFGGASGIASLGRVAP